jgi:hypothetical protein
MARGGARPGAGRPKGARDKLEREAAEAAALEGVMPRDFLLAIMRDETESRAVRMQAAKDVAPYFHAKLASVEHSGSISDGHEDALDALR